MTKDNLKLRMGSPDFDSPIDGEVFRSIYESSVVYSPRPRYVSPAEADAREDERAVRLRDERDRVKR